MAAVTQDIAIPFLIFFASVFLVRTVISRTRNKPRRPPGPLSWPIIGHRYRLGPVTHQAFHKLSTRYGPLVYLHMGAKPCVIASTPEVAEEILKDHESSFMNRPKAANIEYITYGSADFATVDYGPHWKFMKKVCMTQLLGNRTLEQLLPIRREEVRQFLKLVMKKAEAKEEVNVGAELMRLTNNTISRMTLSTRCSEEENEADEVRELVKELNLLASKKFNPANKFSFRKKPELQENEKRLKDARDKYDVMIERIMKEHEDARRLKRESSGAEKDLLDILLDIYEDQNAERRLSRENIKAFIMNIFGAGTDTSSITVEWGLAELINHPNVMKKLRQEIDSVVGRSRLVEESDIANLPYLQAVIKEILRLHPTGPLVARESNEECTISGYRIPAKTILYLNLWSLGRDPKHWENPLEFLPERFCSEEWEPKNNMLDVRGQHFHMMPFGFGRRSCPGASFALQFIPLTLAAMVQCFEWKVGDGDDSKVDMEEGPGLTLPRAHSLVCFPVTRINPHLLN